MRKRLSEKEAIYIGIENILPKTKDGNPKYSLTWYQWEKVKTLRNHGLIDAFDRQGVDPTTSPDLWLKGKEESIRIKNPFYEQPTEKSYKELEETAIDSVSKFIEGNAKPIKVNPKSIVSSYDMDVLVFTDVHIGMDPNKTGYSLYGGVWNENEIMDRLTILIEKTIAQRRSNKLVIFDLGDFMDGWDGETVRKGHKLPQNMLNETAFDVGLTFKMGLIQSLSNLYPNIDIINICDDNHAGSFGYVVNSAFEKLCKSMYDNVNVINQRKFIDHYIYDNRVFVATHGKDGANLKFGFKPKLDPVQIEKIENYMFENNLINPDYEIYFIKGDSHQDIFDNTTSQKFKYWNFPAFSPSSNWVQTNFKKGVSGFYNISFGNDGNSLNPYYFPWRRS